MNTVDYNTGGWRDSMLRKNLNDESTGTIWNAIQSTDFKNNIAPVLKITNNNANSKGISSNASSTTVDKLFILSPSEIGIAIVKDYNILNIDYNNSGYQYNNSNVHYYNNEQDSYINTLKTSEDSAGGFIASEYDYMYAGNTYEWFMLPSGSRKMKNNNQSYHNTDLYSYCTLANYYFPSQQYTGYYSYEFWLRSPAASRNNNFFSHFHAGRLCDDSYFYSSMNDASVVLAFAF